MYHATRLSGGLQTDPVNRDGQHEHECFDASRVLQDLHSRTRTYGPGLICFKGWTTTASPKTGAPAGPVLR
jgi:hypothetical protein